MKTPLIVLLALALQSGSAADRGLSPTEIVIGQCAALSGPAAGLGAGMKIGLLAAIDEANAKGGIHGRKIRLISVDDGYEPEKCVDCTAKLIDDGVFALAGYVGTPTSKVAAPIAQEAKVPLVGLFTGADLLRRPVQRYVVNIRASYDDETEALVGHLVDESGKKRIAVFYQDDSFGLSGLSGAEKALARRKMAVVAKGRFERNTLAVKAGLASLLEGQPDAVIIVAPYKPTAEFVRQARAEGLKSQLSTISFVGTESLIAELGPAADGMLISQVVPSPSDASLPLAKDYQAALKTSAPTEPPTYVSFEGYLSGRVLLAALERAGADLSREKLVDAIEAISGMNFGGVQISFSPTNHQGSVTVFLTHVEQGKAKPLPSVKN